MFEKITACPYLSMSLAELQPLFVLWFCYSPEACCHRTGSHRSSLPNPHCRPADHDAAWPGTCGAVYWFSSL